MNNSIFKNIKKIISAIIQNRLLMILVRAIIICIIFFYIIPKFYPLLLKDIITKIEVSILTIILLEFIILKMSLTNKKEDAKEVEKKDTNIDKDFLTGKLDYAIKNRPCFLFLHVNSVSMNELLSKQNYTRLSIDPAQDDKIKLFDNFYNVIIGCKIDEFKKLILNEEDQYILNNLIKCLKNNKSSSINLVVTVKDLIEIEKNSENFYKNFYSIIQYINNKLNRKYNINILIDQIGQIKGFKSFLSTTKNLPQSMLGVNFICSINKKNIMIKYLKKEFAQFGINLEADLHKQINQSIAEYQNAYYFITQIKELYPYIEKIIECIALPKKKYIWKRNKEVLLGVYFINSILKEVALPPIIINKFSDNIEMIEGKND